MINKSAVCVWLAIDVVDSVERVLKPLVHSDPVALGLVASIVRHKCLIHLCLFVDLAQLVLLQ